MESIPETIPNLSAPSAGYRLHPCCPKAMDIGREVMSVSVMIEPGHAVSCPLCLSA